MRLILIPLVSMPLYTRLVVLPAGLLLLIPPARRTHLLRPRQRCTWSAVPVSTVAPPADQHLTMTPLAAEGPAVLWDHP